MSSVLHLGIGGLAAIIDRAALCPSTGAASTGIHFIEAPDRGITVRRVEDSTRRCVFVCGGVFFILVAQEYPEVPAACTVHIVCVCFLVWCI